MTTTLTEAAKLNPETARWYDHAVNSANAAEGSAIARARRDAIQTGTAYTVVACWNGSTPFTWNGCLYDALSLAKSVKFNRGAVRLIRPDGTDVEDISGAKY